MVVLPVFVTRHRWENLLHNQSTILLGSALRAQGTRVVTTVGFYLCVYSPLRDSITVRF